MTDERLVGNGEVNSDSGPEGIPKDLLDQPDQYEDALPYLKHTIQLVGQYGSAKVKGRRRLIDNEITSLRGKGDLQRFESVTENLDLIEQLQPESSAPRIREELLREIETMIGRGFNAQVWTPDRIELLTRLGLDSNPRTQVVINQLKKVVYNSPATIEQAVDCLYNSAWAMVTTKDPNVREELFSTLCYEQEHLPPGNDTTLLYNASMFIGSDDYIRKHYAVQNAIEKVGEITLYSDPNTSISQTRTDRRFIADMLAFTNALQNSSPKLGNYLMREFENNAKRISKIQAYMMAKPLRKSMTDIMRKDDQRGIRAFSLSESEFAEQARELIKEKSQDAERPWPENLWYDRTEPLNRYISEVFISEVERSVVENSLEHEGKDGYRKLNSHYIPIEDQLELIVVAAGVRSPEQASHIVREVYAVLSGEKVPDSVEPSTKDIKLLKQVVDAGVLAIVPYDAKRNIGFCLLKRYSDERVGKLASILEYHRPGLTLEQTQVMNERVQQVRQNIRTDFVRTAGKRGHVVMVAEPALRDFGYEAMIFTQNEQDQTEVVIVIAGQEYRCLVDSHYRFIEGYDVLKLLNAQDHAWLELLILSHLKTVMCTKEDEKKDKFVGEERQYATYRKQVVSRGECLRKLPPGQGYTERAFGLCLKSQLPQKNLHAINRDRGAKKETGMWTYVSHVDAEDSPQSGPVRVAFKDAANDLKDVVPLREVSHEEYQRMEEFILSDL